MPIGVELSELLRVQLLVFHFPFVPKQDIMHWFAEHGLQLAFVAAYLALLAFHGWHGKRRTRLLDDYLIGGRGLGGTIVALSFYATFVSSVTFVGHSGRTFTRGPSWWLICVVVFTGMVLVAWFVVAPPFVRQARRWGVLTIPEFLGARYGSLVVRRLAGLVVVAASLAYMLAVYEGAARILESLLGLEPLVVTAVIFVVVTTYTLFGGFHSVVATDAVQGVILFAGGMLLPIMMIVRKGGLMPLLDAVRDADPAALNWTGHMPLVTMIGLALGVGLKFIVDPRQLSRFYGLSSDEQLRRGRWIAPALLFVTYLGMLPVGMFAHAFVGSSDRFVDASGCVDSDLIIPWLLGPNANLLGPVAGAFFLTALLAAAMSSLDSVLLVAASSVDHDVIAPGRDSLSAMWLTRLWVLILSAAAAGLSIFIDEGIVEMSSFSGSMYAACFLPTLVMGLFWRRGTAAGAMAALIVGLTATLLWFCLKTTLFNGAYWSWHEVYVGSAVSMSTYVVVSFATRSRPQ